MKTGTLQQNMASQLRQMEQLAPLQKFYFPAREADAASKSSSSDSITVM